MRIKTLGLGIVFIVVAGGGGLLMAEQSSWRPGIATVESVVKQCEMTATERGVLTKTTFSATIDCGDIPAFEQIHSDKTWRSTPVYTGLVSVERDGTTTTTEMPLRSSGSREPQVGDSFAVIQDPADPSKIAVTSQTAAYPIIAAVSGLLGALCIWFGIRGPMPRRDRAVALPETPPSQSAPSDDLPSQPSVTPTYAPPRSVQPRLASGRRVFGKRGAA